MARNRPPGIFVAMNADEFVLSFDPAADPYRGCTIADVVAELCDLWSDDPHTGIGVADLAVWRDGKLEATIRLGENGAPIAETFEYQPA